MFMRTRIGLTIAVFILSGCSFLPGMQNPNVSAMKVAPSHPITIQPTLIPITPDIIRDQHISKYIYRVAPADILNITVWQHAEFSPRAWHTNQMPGVPSTHGAAGQEGYLVNPDGYIYFPLVGNILVGGKTVDEVRISITQRLKKYVKRPEINVRVVDFRGRKVYVMGEIIKPGFLPLNDQPLTITDAISLSGGLDPNASDPEHIYVIRGNMTVARVYWLNAKTPDALLLAEHFNLRPGDILYVSSATATRWNRMLNQLLPTIQTIWYTKAIIDTNNS